MQTTLLRLSTATLLLGLGLLFSPALRAEDQEWGTIKGKVFYDGKAPEPAVIPVPAGACPCLTGKLFEEKWVVDVKTGGVANVLVWLVPDGGGKLPIHPSLKDPPSAPVEIDQPCCQFVPHVTAVRVGQRLIIKNSATFQHNANFLSKESGNFNVLLQPGDKKKLDDLKAERIPAMLSCAIHPWMNARIGIFDHPYYAVTDDKGKFEIKLAPAGKYRLVTYHEEVGWGPGGKEGQPITIAGKSDTEAPAIKIKKSDD